MIAIAYWVYATSERVHLMTNKSIRVLVVDDDNSVLEFFAELLSVRGINVEAAPDYATAVKKIGEAGYDVGFIDVGLPDASGIDVLKELKSSQPGVSCAMISGSFNRAVKQEALKLGADRYLSKPLSLHDVYDVILKRLQRAGSHDIIGRVYDKFGNDLQSRRRDWI